MKTIIATMLVLMSSVAFSAISVPENENINLSLSKNNINRLLLTKDKITKFRYPQGFLELDQNDSDGSIYLTGLYEKPFTVFVTTKRGHHFSININAINGPGKTVEIKNTTPSIMSANRWEGNGDIKESASKLINYIASGNVPDGYSIENDFPKKTKRFNRWLTIKKIKQFKGDRLTASIYQLTNNDKNPVYLKESEIHIPGSIALYLDSRKVESLSTVTLYRVSGESDV